MGDNNIKFSILFSTITSILWGKASPYSLTLSHKGLLFWPFDRWGQICSTLEIHAIVVDCLVLDFYEIYVSQTFILPLKLVIYSQRKTVSKNK